jgi:hypothetical protein
LVRVAPATGSDCTGNDPALTADVQAEHVSWPNARRRIVAPRNSEPILLLVPGHHDATV